MASAVRDFPMGTAVPTLPQSYNALVKLYRFQEVLRAFFIIFRSTSTNHHTQLSTSLYCPSVGAAWSRFLSVPKATPSSSDASNKHNLNNNNNHHDKIHNHSDSYIPLSPAPVDSNLARQPVTSPLLPRAPPPSSSSELSNQESFMELLTLQTRGERVQELVRMCVVTLGTPEDAEVEDRLGRVLTIDWMEKPGTARQAGEVKCVFPFGRTMRQAR